MAGNRTPANRRRVNAALIMLSRSAPSVIYFLALRRIGGCPLLAPKKSGVIVLATPEPSYGMQSESQADHDCHVRTEWRHRCAAKILRGCSGIRPLCPGELAPPLRVCSLARLLGLARFQRAKETLLRSRESGACSPPRREIIYLSAGPVNVKPLARKRRCSQNSEHPRLHLSDCFTLHAFCLVAASGLEPLTYGL